MPEEELKDIEEMLEGKMLLDDEEILYYLRQDVPKMIGEIRQLRDTVKFLDVMRKLWKWSSKEKI